MLCAGLGVTVSAGRTNRHHVRDRRNALTRKNFLEASILEESEIVVEKTKLSMVTSPTSVLSPPPTMVMKPMKLPDAAWTVVGKGGKPLKQLPTQKKRKRIRRRVAKAVMPSELLAEGRLSSKALALHHARVDQLQRGKARSLQLKHWLKRRQRVAAARAARDAHIQFLEAGDEMERRDESHKGPRRSREKKRWQAARRQVRRMASAARCLPTSPVISRHLPSSPHVHAGEADGLGGSVLLAGGVMEGGGRRKAVVGGGRWSTEVGGGGTQWWDGWPRGTPLLAWKPHAGGGIYWRGARRARLQEGWSGGHTCPPTPGTEQRVDQPSNLREPTGIEVA